MGKLKGHISSACTQRQQPICRLCKEPGHEGKNCPTVTCFKCKQLGHMTSNCPENRKGETAGPQTPKIIYERCKEHGHKVTNCPQVTCFKCKNKGHVPSSCPINILEGKTTKKTDSKARMQIEMLKNQTQLNQKDLLVLESQAPPPPRSRFDQQFRPGRQSQLAQPGVVVPQTIYVPNHPPPVVSMVSHPLPPQMGYDTSRMRSRSPPRQGIIERPSDSLSRAYEDHRSTRLRSRSPPAHSGGYGSSRRQSRSPGSTQGASIDNRGGTGSLSRAYDEHRLRQSQQPRRS